MRNRSVGQFATSALAFELDRYSQEEVVRAMFDSVRPGWLKDRRLTDRNLQALLNIAARNKVPKPDGATKLGAVLRLVREDVLNFGTSSEYLKVVLMLEWLAPKWFEGLKSVDDVCKEEILSLPVEESRPRRCSQRGEALSVYTSSGCFYDHEFTLKVRSRFPHWGVSTRPNSKYARYCRGEAE